MGFEPRSQRHKLPKTDDGTRSTATKYIAHQKANGGIRSTEVIPGDICNIMNTKNNKMYITHNQHNGYNITQLVYQKQGTTMTCKVVGTQNI